MASIDGDYNVSTDETKSAAARPNSGKNIPIYANILHLFISNLPSWFSDLLDME